MVARSTRPRRAARVTEQPPRAQKEHSAAPEHVPRYISKTRLCSFHLSGHCARGAACTFAHGKHELKAKTDFSRTQLCAKGSACEDPRCAFAHDASELRVLAPEDLGGTLEPRARPTLRRAPTAAKEDERSSHVRSPMAANVDRTLRPEPSRQLQQAAPRSAATPALPMKVASADLLSFECTGDGSLGRWDAAEPCYVDIPKHLASAPTFASWEESSPWSC